MKNEGLLSGQEGPGSDPATDPSRAASSAPQGGPDLRAVLRIRADARSSHTVSPLLTGKFCEHLGSNIYNGMCAEVLRNPTFADFPFGGGGTHPDGGAKFLCDEEAIGANIRNRAARMKWSEEAAERLVESRADGLAHWWVREGPREAVSVSPDVGPHGERAQRVEVRASGEGIAQWTHLPLHRVRKYDYELLVRSPDLSRLSLSISEEDGAGPSAVAEVAGLSRSWRKFTGSVEIGPSSPAEAIYRFAITASSPGQFVVARVLLWPADHLDGADPDVVRLLKDSRLPVLRWPGGNFVSGYHWEDGVGPRDERPTRPNPAWGGVELNLFGTDEFVAFCRAVGAEPMICLNAGDAGPDEAARWVEYCNGPPDSAQGSRRAKGGHPDPFRVRYWEIGNELSGRHQIGWTTPAGYADRFREFAEAMLGADPDIELFACGAPVIGGGDWNETLFRENATVLRRTTDHPLLGGRVPSDTDPLDVYRDFMAFPVLLESKYAELREDMLRAGITDPRLAITELQLFAGIAKAEGEDVPARLTRANLVSPATLAEALYDTLYYHAAVRLLPFVDMVTHSATVNHGGGLRKERERVYANPCHHAQAMFASLARAVPVAVELTSARERPPLVLPQLRAAKFEVDVSVLDCIAAVAPSGELLVSIVHRGTSGPVELSIELEGFDAAGQAEVRTLSAAVPWAVNSLEAPDAVKPLASTVAVEGNRLSVELPLYSVTQVRVPI